MSCSKGVFARERNVARGLVMAGLVFGVALAGKAGAAINQWSPVPIDGGPVEQIVFASGSSSTLYLIAGYGVYRSIDAGASWRLLGEPCSGRCRIAPDPTNADRILVASMSSRLHSSTNGAAPVPVESLPSYQADAVQFSADGAVVYATSGVNFYRGNNGVSTWETRNPMAATAGGIYTNQILVDPANAQTVVVHRTDGLLYITRDGGGSWQTASPPPNSHVSRLAFSQVGPQRLWAATNFGLFISSDLGAHWSSAGLSGYTSTVVAHPTDPRILYVSSYVGNPGAMRVLRSTDEAVTWTPISTDLGAAGHSISISPVSPQSIATGGEYGAWLSTDGGVTGTHSNAGIRAASIRAMAAAVASDRVYLMGNGEIFRLDGSSGSVTGLGDAMRASFPGQSLFLTGLVAQSLNPDRLILGANTGVVRSTDGGASWSEVRLANMPQSLADSPVSEDTLILGSFSGVYRSTDAGVSWTAAQGLPTPAYVPGVSMGSRRSYASVWTTSTSPNHFDTGRGIYRSEDNGATWVPANAGIENIMVQSLALDPLDDRRLYALSGIGLFLTLDAGATWNAVTWPRFGTGAFLLALDPINPLILYAANSGTIDRSIDGGTTWEQLRSTPSLYRQPASILVDPVRPNTVIVGVHGGGAEQITIAPDLSLEADAASATASPGARVTRRFTLRNIGPFHSTHPRVSFTIPDSATDLSVSVSGATASCTRSVPAFVCSLESLRAGFSVLFDVAFTQPAAGSFGLTASVAGDQSDVVASNNSAQSTLHVGIHADVTASLAGPSTATEGDALSYTLTVGNAGPDAAADTQVSWPLPTGFAASTATPSVGSCTISSSSVSCSIGTLQPLASATVRLEATAPAAGTYRHNATVSATVADTNGTNNAAIVTTTVAARSAPPSPTPSPPTSGGGGGGGGGSTSLLLALALVSMRFLGRRRALPI